MPELREGKAASSPKLTQEGSILMEPASPTSLPTQPQPAPPPITNRPEEILSAWTALEVLSPPAFVRPEDLAAGERTRVARFDDSPLPWERGEKSRPNFRLYYQVVLGSIKMEPAITRLIERFGDDRLERPAIRGRAVLAIVIVDRQGALVDVSGVGVSSFGWGVTTAINGELADLSQWPQVEPALVNRIEKSLLNAESDDELKERKRQPLTKDALLRAYLALINDLGLPNEWMEPPEFAIRSYAFFKDSSTPEPLMLNSFFLSDLALARRLFEEKKAPLNLRRYLGVEAPQAQKDLLHDATALSEAISPTLTPLSRWPGPGRSPLVLLQQAAVNLAFRETKAGGLLGVNGPPGTGKTTLLRDLVAGVVTERAEAMARFDDPEKAFEHSGQKLAAGNGWIHLYRLNPSLRGFEMIVASSNNKAVENVSAELPGLSAVAADAPNLRYFKTLSDSLHQSETWGAIAAVLGNALNRGRFKQSFWWDEDNGLNSYLRTAAGATLEVQEQDPVTGKITRRKPRIVQNEKPPSTHEEALARWRTARQRFLNALGKSRQWQSKLQNLYDDIARLPALARAEADAATAHDTAAMTVQHIEAETSIAQQAEADAALAAERANKAIQTHNAVKPGFWARLFRTAPAREWALKAETIQGNHRNAQARYSQASTDLRQLESDLLQVREVQQKAKAAWQKSRDHHQQTRQRLADARQQDGIELVDETFFALDHGERHQMTPWFPTTAQQLRDDVFISAMALHRAFIDATAKPLRHNLGALMNVFTTQTLPGPEKQKLLPDLWASLFLAVPLISTTFASVQRMLGKLPIESLGWLLVDEAGQALPQAAVGALLGTRRAIFVGDPVQIEPVVLLPDTLTRAICRRFGVDPDHYAAPSASAQTLADSASAYISEFQTQIGSRSVGVPLLVHRRCSEPMFGVSNKIAYSGMMVSAKSPKPSAIRDVLGPSKWIHVEGNGKDKWCPEEGKEVLRLLRQLTHAGVPPDIYLITPFVIVADNLRQIMRESGLLKTWGIEDDWRWVYERIGTVHTVQGREAEAVFLVLGAPMSAQTGARGWAGSRPNLLNVAVTRAKEVLYVIGNRRHWSEAGLFRELDLRLP